MGGIIQGCAIQGYAIQNSRFKIQECAIQDSRFKIQGCAIQGYAIQDSRFKIQKLKDLRTRKYSNLFLPYLLLSHLVRGLRRPPLLNSLLLL